MDNDEYTIDIFSDSMHTINSSISDVVITASDTWSDLLTDTIDLSTITIDTVDYDGYVKSSNMKKQIPVDIWAKIYNNGIIDD